MTAAVELEGVGKRYRQTNDGGMLVKRLVTLGLGRRRHQDMWALQDISFSCDTGDTLGVIGRNGSGKTTLLRLLAGVSAPTVGRLRVVGSIAPLIGVGVGFNPELTGRENVFANGQILGMTKARITRELDEIVEFSELEAFLDVPVKFYSSGMFLRLGFAVAIQVRPEVLLVDEILAVGDIAFQAKCMERMSELQRSGATILVVTHSMATLHRMCTRTIVLSQGAMAFDGDTDDAISVFHELMQSEGARRNAAGVAEGDAGAAPFIGGARVTCEVVDADGRPSRQVDAGSPIFARVSASFDEVVDNPVVGIAVVLQGLGVVYMAHVQPGDYRAQHGPGAPLEYTLQLENSLLAGSFQVVSIILDDRGRHELGRSTSELFAVTSSSDARGLVNLDARFTIAGEEYVPRQLRLTP